MKRIFIKFSSILLLFFSLLSCKKDRVDATNLQSFQASINDMSIQLSTIKQYKFNEALYVIKTFGLSAKGEMQKMKELSLVLNGKNTQDIFKLADDIAKKNSYNWSSTDTPSMGDMNIFQNLTAIEYDPNDIKASSLNIDILPKGGSSTETASGIQIIPSLVDDKDQKVIFDKAGLSCTFEVLSNSIQIFKSKTIILDNNFSGIYIPFNKLSQKLVVDDKIDIRVSIETTKKTYKLLKTGIMINTNALYVPSEKINPIADTISTFKPTEVTENESKNTIDENKPVEESKPVLAPKAQLSLFLNNLNAKNFRSAFDKAQNPNWGSFENFSNSNTGFGSIQKLDVKKIQTQSENDQMAQYEAEYLVTDKNGNTTNVKSQYSLKLLKNQWKITNYKIISAN